MTHQKPSELDQKILRALQLDGRRSFNDISKEIGVSTETVRNRFNSMKSSGLIFGTTAVVDPKKANGNRIIFIGIQTDLPNSPHILKKVKELPGVCVVTRSIGRYDIEAIAIQKNIEEISVTKDRIGDFPGVKNVDIDIMVDKMLLCPKNFEFEEEGEG